MTTTSDASSPGVDTVVSRRVHGWVDRTTGFVSRSPTPAKRNRAGFAVVFVMKRFHMYALELSFETN